MQPIHARPRFRVFAVAAAIALAGCAARLLGIGSSIAASPAALAFGQVTAGATGQIRVNVSNSGSVPLQISAIRVASDPAAELSVGALLTTNCNDVARSGGLTLGPGECARFTAFWVPRGAQHDAAGAIEIDSSDPESPVISLPVSGTALPSMACTPVCAAGQTCCGGACADTRSDPAHCGGCAPCAAGQTCSAGVCKTPAVEACDDLTAPCASPDKCCNHACVDVSASGGICPCTGNGGTSNFGVGSIIISGNSLRYGGLTSVFAQRGDFPFNGFFGAITDYHPDPDASASWNPGVVSYITGTDKHGSPSNLFASIDQHAQGKGTVVYLAGHDYSYKGENGTAAGITAGSRLVLNTLFSLGENNICAP